ncbi:MAG TPA: hypothetical protein ENK10_07975, partial [Acidobacteria bacterium]|nr:hypothetical protein [Acidobacteriota bacterium]
MAQGARCRPAGCAVDAEGSCPARRRRRRTTASRYCPRAPGRGGGRGLWGRERVAARARAARGTTRDERGRRLGRRASVSRGAAGGASRVSVEGGPAGGVASRRLAAEILERVEKGAWAGRLLAARADRLSDRRDRALLSRLVLDTLRWQGALDPRLSAHLSHPLDRLAPPVRALLRLGLCQALVMGIPAPVAVSTVVDAARSAGAGRGAGLINAVLRRCCRQPAAPLDPRACFPSWLIERWTRRWDAARAEALAAACNRRARPFVVALGSSGGPEALAASLAEEGVETVPSTEVPGGLEVQAGAPQLSVAHRRGACVILDPSAARVAILAAAVAPEGLAVDLAAAPGGK